MTILTKVKLRRYFQAKVYTTTLWGVPDWYSPGDAVEGARQFAAEIEYLLNATLWPWPLERLPPVVELYEFNGGGPAVRLGPPFFVPGSGTSVGFPPLPYGQPWDTEVALPLQVVGQKLRRVTLFFGPFWTPMPFSDAVVGSGKGLTVSEAYWAFLLTASVAISNTPVALVDIKGGRWEEGRIRFVKDVITLNKRRVKMRR